MNLSFHTSNNDEHRRDVRGRRPPVWWAFFVKECRHIVRDKRTMLVLFGMPIVMMLLFGYAIRTDVKDVRTLVVTASMDHTTQRIVERIGASEYFNVVGTAGSAAQAEEMLRHQRADMAIVFTGEFANHRYDDATIQVLTDAADPSMAQQYVNYIRQILATDMSDADPPILVRQLYNPSMQSSYNFVPGIMGMLLLLICAIMTSISVVREKEYGTMEVLLVSPVRPITIILSKAVPYLLLSFAIIVVVLLMTRFVLGVPLAGSLFWIIAVSLIYILLALSLGLIISNVASSQFVALLISAMMLLLPSVMLSGMVFPVASMPKILRWISAIVPATYYISALRKLMIMGVGVGQVARDLGVLVGYTALLMVVAFLTFKRRLQ